MNRHSTAIVGFGSGSLSQLVRVSRYSPVESVKPGRFPGLSDPKPNLININAPAGFVKIPTTGAGPQGPTGQVNNTNTSSFPVNGGGDGKSAHFIFANLNGTISAWDTGPTAFIQVTTPGAVYTGLAINGAQTRLYAADDVPPGRIDVFDSSFAPVGLAAGAFVDPSLPAGLVPFNVQNIGGDIYVT